MNMSSTTCARERVVVFDEAQRAWNIEQTTRFMREKRGHTEFDMSEPQFLMSVMDRHKDWCVVVCLIGGGQEINTGEAGLEEWLVTIERNYPDWHIHLSDRLTRVDYLGGSHLPTPLEQLGCSLIPGAAPRNIGPFLPRGGIVRLRWCCCSR
jgi:hypothetical protein